MARSCGIRIGSRRFELVVLEGAARSPRVVTHVAGEIPPGEDPAAAASAALRQAATEHKVPADNVGLVVDTGLAAFRNVTLPFDDPDKIEEVLKYEVESQLPQWNIDDVVVDWLLLESQPGQQRLTAVAVPKAALRPLLAVCEKAGLDALEAELELTAALDAAHLAGRFPEDSAQILVHVGESSTSVAVIDGGKLSAVRAIPIGALPPADKATGAEAPAAEEEARPEPAAPSGPAWSAEAAGQRLARELRRTIIASQTRNPLGEILLTGFELPALSGATDLGLRTERFRPFEADAEGGEDPALFCAAFGGALSRLGGTWLSPSLRREDLRYAGRFERLELPLAVAGLLLVAVLAVHLILTLKKIEAHEADLSTWMVASNNYMLGDPKKASLGRLRRPPERIKNYAELAVNDRDADRTKYEQLVNIRTLLNREIMELRKRLGQDTQITKPQSALEGASLVFGLMADMADPKDDRIGRFAIRSVTSDYLFKSSGGDSVTVKLDLTFFAEDDVVATRHYNNFVNEIQTRPWCKQFTPRGTTPLENGQGIFADAVTIELDLSHLRPAAPAAAGEAEAEG